jgi:SAM-dependent methyltransferase
VPEASSGRWADTTFLRETQYADDSNLAARQHIYAYCAHLIDLPAVVIDSLGLAGQEIVVDVGCGNGLYLAELAGRGHRGQVAGVDLSAGMLRAARARAPAARFFAGDAARLPLRDGAADLTLAMHMLYHVAEPALAVAELRRATRPGGRVVVGLNSDDHLCELRALVNAELFAAGLHASHIVRERIRLDAGAELLAGVFDSVISHDVTGELRLPDQRPVADYVRSMSITRGTAEGEQLVQAVAGRLDFDADGIFRVTTHSGWLVCS